MTYICYTMCDTNHRWFTTLDGVCISYDRQLITSIIAQNTEYVDTSLETIKMLEDFPVGEVDPIIKRMKARNERAAHTLQQDKKRWATAEAVVNDRLVHSIVYVETLQEAISYTVRT